jgi:AcrR family transcriptional regulator
VGVSPAAPYRHFDSRAALLEALAVTGYGRFTQIMDTIARSDEPEPKGAMGRAYVRFALDNRNLFRLMFSPQLRRDGRPGLRIAADAAYQTLRHVIDGDTDSGRFAAIAAWSRVHGLAMLLLDGQVQLKPDEDIDALVAQVLAAP